MSLLSGVLKIWTGVLGQPLILSGKELLSWQGRQGPVVVVVSISSLFFPSMNQLRRTAVDTSVGFIPPGVWTTAVALT